MLAGGGSRRFGGRPKGLERVGVQLRLLDFVVSALAQVAHHVILVSNDPNATAWLPGKQVVPDRHPGLGGLAGVEAALGEGGDAIVVAWDMPFVTGSLLQSLVDAAQAHDADVVVPESASPHGFEPFCAFYSTRVRAPLSEFLSAGGGAAHEFIRSVGRLHVLPTNEVGWSGDPKRLLFSVNTPEDLDRARAMLATTQ